MTSGVAVVTGAAGQDGFFLCRRLLAEGWVVHGVVREAAAVQVSAPQTDQFVEHRIDLLDVAKLDGLIAAARPDEIYNLAGQSSVAQSFAAPRDSWRANAEGVVGLLEAVRRHAPDARVYQSSSGEMFGWRADLPVVHSEDSALAPQSPYAAAKAAAHLLCGAYRRAYGIRVACGILFNHESHRRPEGFLSRKVIDHVRRVRGIRPSDRGRHPPLAMGNLGAQRDWGFAPDYVDGMVSIVRQISVRSATLGRPAEPDDAAHYRDYILATGQLHAVWQFVDRAFALAGMPLDWEREPGDVSSWCARFSDGAPAVVVDPALLRPSDPPVIEADPSLARRELGWRPRTGLDHILGDMLDHG